MREGNPVNNSDGSSNTGSQNMSTDANGNMQLTPDVPIVQPTSTSQLLTVTGKSTSGVLTTTLVNGSDVTTTTKGAFMRVNLTDSSGLITNGNYYIELFTIT